MPCYPALALLLGSALTSDSPALRFGTKLIRVIAALAAGAILIILFLVRHTPTPGDISVALSQNPELYTLSLGHIADLTLNAFAYLRLPLALAAVAFAVSLIPSPRSVPPILPLSLMMLLFFHAATRARVAFDPFLSSRPLAEALLRQPPGQLIAGD